MATTTTTPDNVSVLEISAGLFRAPVAVIAPAPSAPPEPKMATTPAELELERIAKVLKNAGMEGVWKGYGNVQSILADLRYPAEVRAALGLTQKQLGRLIAELAGRPRPYTAHAVSAWEWWSKRASTARGWERFELTKKYSPPESVIAAYVAAVRYAALTSAPAAVGVRAVATRARPIWRFELVLVCRTCGRRFTPERGRLVNCKRCRG